MNGALYVYFDPKTNVPRYVGMSCPDRGQPHKRAREHLTRTHNVLLGRMLKKRMAEGYDCEPKVFLLGTDDRALVAEAEELLIAMIGKTRDKTGTLFNIADGGDGRSGATVSLEERAKRSKAMTGIKWSKETIEKRRKANTGKKASAEARNNMRRAHLGVPLSESHRAALAAANARLKTCPFCGTQGRGFPMSKFHFKNCKEAT